MVFAALLRIGGGVLSIGAGWYLLSRHSLPVDVNGQSGQSWLEALAHGIGIYFIARGLEMIGSAIASMYQTPEP
ncbi:MAG TPA: hypothetical protein VN449_04440, partial [Gaiellaceae bacterium]|nr:hypothetical protein [Gaiellaceae bacterium]